MTTTTTPQLVGASAAARLLGITRDGVYKAYRRGDLEGAAVLDNGKIRFDAGALVRLLQDRGVPAPPVRQQLPALRTEAERNALAETWRYLPRKVLKDMLRRPSLARRVRCFGLDDLEQVGQLGLLRAAELFNQERGLKFTTFAYSYVRGFMRHALSREAKWLAHRIPNGSPSHKYRVPVDAPDPPDRTRPRPDGALDLADALTRLTPRDRAVIAGYYGLDGGPSLSTRQLGKRFGIGTSRAGQLLNRAQDRVAIYCLSGK